MPIADGEAMGEEGCKAFVRGFVNEPRLGFKDKLSSENTNCK